MKALQYCANSSIHFFVPQAHLGCPFSRSRFTKKKKKCQFQVQQIIKVCSYQDSKQSKLTLGNPGLNLVDIEPSQTDIIQIPIKQRVGTQDWILTPRGQIKEAKQMLSSPLLSLHGECTVRKCAA